MMDDATLERGLRAQPPMDPIYRSRIGTGGPAGNLRPAAAGRVTVRPRSSPANAWLVVLILVAVAAGGLLLAVGQQQPTPATVWPSPSASGTLMERLTTHEVEPGVYRVVSDGVRDLDWTVADLPYGGFASGVAARADGSVWLRQGGSVFQLGDDADDADDAGAGLSWDDLAADTLARHWTAHAGTTDDEAGIGIVLTDGRGRTAQDLPATHLVRQLRLGGNEYAWSLSLAGSGLGVVDPDKFLVGLAPDGALWIRMDRQRFLRYDPTANALGEYDSTDGVPNMHAVLDGPGLFHVAVDGSVWMTGTPRHGFCDGVSHFDGTTWTHYLAGQCVYTMDSAPDGSLWLQASSSTDILALGTTWTYLIRPEP